MTNLEKMLKSENIFETIWKINKVIYGIDPYKDKIAEKNAEHLADFKSETKGKWPDDEATDEDKAENMNPDGDIFSQEIEAEIDLQEE